MIEAAAMLTLVMPEPQKRSSVTPLVRDVVAGVERRHPPEVAALRPALGTGAPDDVLDVSGIDPATISRTPARRRTQLLRMDAGKSALAGLADAPRRSAGVDDQRVNHECFLPCIVPCICRRHGFKVNSSG